MRDLTFLSRTPLLSLAALTALSGIAGAAQAQAAKPVKAAKKPIARTVTQTPSLQKPPPLGPPHALQLPAVVEKTLPNGLHIVLLENHKQPALWIRLAVPAGGIRDTKDKVGLSSLVANQLEKGTPTRTESQIAETVDNLGANLSASSDDDFITVSASGLSNYANTLLDLVADVTLHPTFPAIELERSRTRVLNEISYNLSQPGTLADAAIGRLIFGEHPYGDFNSGTPKTVAGIQQADLVSFHQTYFVPNKATLFLVGDITLEQAMKLAQAAFGDWTPREAPPLPDPPVVKTAAGTDTPQITLIDRPDAAQTEIRIGTLTTGYSDPDRIPASVATAVLGLGQFERRLSREIRVKRGLTYGAASYFSRKAQAGYFAMTTFTKNVSTGEVVKIALDEERKLASILTPTDELQARKDFLLGSFAVSVATPNGVLSRLIPAVLYGGGPGDLTKYTERVQAVTPQKIQEVVKGLNTHPMEIVLVGSAKAIEKDVTPLGKIKVIPAADVDLLSPTLQAMPGSKDGASKAAPAPTQAELDEGQSRLAATLKAHGGDAFLNLKQMVLKGKGELSPPGPQPDLKIPIMVVTLTSVAPDKSRLDLKTASGDIIMASLTNGGWLSAMGRVMDIPPGFSGSGDPTALLRRAVQRRYSVIPLPAAEKGAITASDGKSLEGFAIMDEKGSVSKVYTDAATHQLHHIVTRGAQGDNVTLISDFHEAGGALLPGKLVIMQNGRQFLSLAFDSFDVTTPVDSGYFVRPRR